MVGGCARQGREAKGEGAHRTSMGYSASPRKKGQGNLYIVEGRAGGDGREVKGERGARAGMGYWR